MPKQTQFVGFQMDSAILVGIMEEAESRGIGYTTFIREIVAYATKGGKDFSILPPGALSRVYRRRTASDIRAAMNAPSDVEQFIAGVRASRDNDIMDEIEADQASDPNRLPNPDFLNPNSPDYVAPHDRIRNTFAAAPTYPPETIQSAGEDDEPSRV